MTQKALDARSHQLAILKLEKRGLKPLARALLSDQGKSAKLAAIGAVSAMLLTLHGAPRAFYTDLGVSLGEKGVSAATIATACSMCDELSLLVQEGAAGERVLAGLKPLFQLVRDSHAAMESAANDVGARLLRADDPNIGGGGKDDPVAWLSQLTIGLLGSSSR